MSSLASRMAARGRAVVSPGRLDSNAEADGPQELQAATLPAPMSSKKLPSCDLKLPSLDFLADEVIPSRSVVNNDPVDFLAPSPVRQRGKFGSSEISNAAPSVVVDSAVHGRQDHKRPRSRSRSAARDSSQGRAARVAYTRTALFGSVTAPSIPIGCATGCETVAEKVASSSSQPSQSESKANPDKESKANPDKLSVAKKNPAQARDPAPVSPRAASPAIGIFSASAPVQRSHGKASASAAFTALLHDDDPAIREVASWGLGQVENKKKGVYRHPRRDSPGGKPNAQADLATSTKRIVVPEQEETMGGKRKELAESQTVKEVSAPKTTVKEVSAPKTTVKEVSAPKTVPGLDANKKRGRPKKDASMGAHSSAAPLQEETTDAAGEKWLNNASDPTQGKPTVLQEEAIDIAPKKRQKKTSSQTKGNAAASQEEGTDIIHKKRPKKNSEMTHGQVSNETQGKGTPENYDNHEPTANSQAGWSRGILVTDKKKNEMLNDPSSKYADKMRAALLFQEAAFDAVVMEMDPGAMNEEENTEGPGNWIYYVQECEDTKVMYSSQAKGEDESKVTPLATGSEFVVPVGTKFKIRNTSKSQKVRLLVMVMRFQPT